MTVLLSRRSTLAMKANRADTAWNEYNGPHDVWHRNCAGCDLICSIVAWLALGDPVLFVCGDCWVPSPGVCRPRARLEAKTAARVLRMPESIWADAPFTPEEELALLAQVAESGALSPEEELALHAHLAGARS